MNIEEMKIHDCSNNTTIFNTDKWVRYEDFQSKIESQQKRIEELENNIITDNSKINENLLKENEELRERVKLVLDSCDNNEKNQDYSIATDSVRAILTDYPIEQLLNNKEI
jgi:septin family protein